MISQPITSFFRSDSTSNEKSIAFSNNIRTTIGIESKSTRFLHERYFQRGKNFDLSTKKENEKEIEISMFSIKPNEEIFSNWQNWFNQFQYDQIFYEREVQPEQQQPQQIEDQIMFENNGGGNIEGITFEEEDVEMKESNENIQTIQHQISEQPQQQKPKQIQSIQKPIVSQTKKKSKQNKKNEKQTHAQVEENVQELIDLTPIDLPIDSKRKNFQ